MVICILWMIDTWVLLIFSYQVSRIVLILNIFQSIWFSQNIQKGGFAMLLIKRRRNIIEIPTSLSRQ